MISPQLHCLDLRPKWLTLTDSWHQTIGISDLITLCYVSLDQQRRNFAHSTQGLIFLLNNNISAQTCVFIDRYEKISLTSE